MLYLANVRAIGLCESCLQNILILKDIFDPGPSAADDSRAGRRILECDRVGAARLQPGGAQAQGVTQLVRLSILRLDAENCTRRVLNRFSGIQELISKKQMITDKIWKFHISLFTHV